MAVSLSTLWAILGSKQIPWLSFGGVSAGFQFCEVGALEDEIWFVPLDKVDPILP
jgi:hypothetical protein